MGCFIKDTGKYWYGALIPYEVDASLADKKAVKEARRVWEDKTVVRFVERTNQKDYVRFVPTDDVSSSSKVGKQGGKQEIELAKGHGTRTVIHEIGHAIGLRHEHQRPDRDKYVKVYKERILNGKWHNFKKLSAGEYGVYDYKSRMHYGSNNFAKELRYNWSSGWTTAELYRVGGSTYLFLLKANGTGSDGNNVHIHKVNTNRTVGVQIQTHRWTSGWTTARFYQAGGSTYLFLLKASGTGSDGKNVHIHRMDSNGTVGSQVEAHKWSGGWTTAEFYTIGGTTYLFLMKKSGTGSDGKNVHIHRMNSNGTVGPQVETHKWSSGWTTAGFYRIGGTTYLFLLKKSGTGSDGKNVHIHRMNSNGTVGPQVETHKWSSGWTTAEFYVTGGSVYLFLLKEGNGHVHMHVIKSNGGIGEELPDIPTIEALHGNTINSTSTLTATDIGAANHILRGNVQIHSVNRRGGVGSKVDVRAWTSGWTTAELFMVSNTTHLFLLKRRGSGSDGKNVHIHKMDTDGTVGDQVAAYDWTDGWTTATFYRAGSSMYLFLLKANGTGSDGNNVHVHVMNSDGTVGAQIQVLKWTSGWTTAEFYRLGNTTYLFLLKRMGAGSDGKNVHIHKMNSDGTVGAQIEAHKWDRGWTTVNFYKVGNTTYCFALMKSGAGSDGKNVHIRKIKPNGTIGGKIETHQWTAGWTTAEFYRIGSATFLFLLKNYGTGSDGSNVHIHRIKTDGKIGAQVEAHKWSVGWTAACFYGTSKKKFLFMLKGLRR